MPQIPIESDPRPIIEKLIALMDSVKQQLGTDEKSQDRQIYISQWYSFIGAVNQCLEELPEIPDNIQVTVPSIYRANEERATRPTTNHLSSQTVEKIEAQVGSAELAQQGSIDSSSKQTSNAPLAQTEPKQSSADWTDQSASTTTISAAPEATEIIIDWVRNQAPMTLPISAESIQTELEKLLGSTIQRNSQTKWSSTDGRIRIVSLVSKIYNRPDGQICWYAFSTGHKAFLDEMPQSYVALCLGSEFTAYVFPFSLFSNWLDSFNTTNSERGDYWHIILGITDGKMCLRTKQGMDSIDVSNFIMGARR